MPDGGGPPPRRAAPIPQRDAARSSIEVQDEDRHATLHFLQVDAQKKFTVNPR
jgi:hypothetical protein